MFVVNSWLIPYENLGPNTPAWTITTLSLWYLFFPLKLPQIQGFTDSELTIGITRLYWFQIGLGAVVFFAFGGGVGSRVSNRRLLQANDFYRI